MTDKQAQAQPQDAAAGKAAVLNELRTKVLKRIDERSACAKKGHVGSRETDLINAAYREIIGDIDYALRTTPASPGKASDVLEELVAWVDGNWFGAIIRPYNKEKTIEAVNAVKLREKIASLRQVQQQ